MLLYNVIISSVCNTENVSRIDKLSIKLNELKTSIEERDRNLRADFENFLSRPEEVGSHEDAENENNLSRNNQHTQQDHLNSNSQTSQPLELMLLN